MRKGLPLVAVGVLLLALCGRAEHPAWAESVLRLEGETTFAELGWTSDALVEPGQPPATVSFEVPRGLRQGEPYWFGVKLVFELEADLARGQDAVLMVEWNGGPAMMIDIERELWDTLKGFRWSIVDAVYDFSGGYEMAGTLVGTAYNVPTIDAVGDGGPTTVSISWHPWRADGAHLRARIKKESAIFVTRWPLTAFDGNVSAEVDGRTLTIRAEGRNVGWHAPRMRVGAVVSFPDGRVQEFWGPDRGRVPAGARIEIEERLTLPEPPFDMLVLVDWGTGQRVFGPDRHRGQPPWSTLFPGGAVAAVVLVVAGWVLASTAFGRGPELVLPRPRRTTAVAVLVLAVIAGSLGGVFWALRAPDRDPVPEYGPVPFPLEPPMPPGFEEQRFQELVGAVLAMEPVQARISGNDATVLFPKYVKYVSRRGVPVGFLAPIVVEGGVDGRGPWRWPACDGSGGVVEEATSLERAPGLIAVTSLDGGSLLYLVPLGSHPDGPALVLRTPCGEDAPGGEAPAVAGGSP